MKIALFIKEELEDSDIATYLISKISEHNFDIDQENPDYVISVGGDGTFLRAVHEYIDQVDSIQFVGINEGSLGFYTDYVMEELDDLLFDLENIDYNRNSFKLIEVTAGDKLIYAVNEIRVENPFHTLKAKVYIDDHFLEQFRGSGLCVCSNAGSTAYNRSLGGAIVALDNNTLQLTELASINNRVYQSLGSSIIFDENSVIVLEGHFSEAVFGYDHLTTKADTDKVTIGLSNRTVTYVYKKNRSVIDRIRESLIK